MTHQEDLNRIEIKHLRDMLEIFKGEIIKLKNMNRTLEAKNEKLKNMNRTLEAKNELYRQELESEYRKSKV